MSKIYFFDLGIRNMVLGNFLIMEKRSDSGALFENFIFLELKNKFTDEQLFFYRTTGKTEIDFIIVRNQSITPLEVKYKHLQRKISTKALTFFQQKNVSRIPYVVNLNLNEDNERVFYRDFRRFLVEVMGK